MTKKVRICDLKALGYTHIRRIDSMQLYIAWKGAKQYLLSYSDIIGIYDNIDKIWWVNHDNISTTTRKQIWRFAMRYPVKLVSSEILSTII